MSEELRDRYIRGLEELNIILNNIPNDYKKRDIRNPIEHKKTRLKSDESILEKLKRKNIKEYNDKEIIENINDVIGARIVCPFLSDVEEIKEYLKGNPNLIFIDEKDFINNPKKSGYRSYHMRVLVRIVRNNKVEYVKAEIQVRTILMDMWASLEHKLSYKKGINFSSETEKEIIDLASLCQELDEDLDKKKTNEQKKNNEFKDILTPEEYERITQKYKVAQEYVMTEINDMYRDFKNNEIDKKEVNPIEHIETRMKPADSLVRKLYKKMKESTIVNIDESISDIAGVRIVCSFERDLENIAKIIKNNRGFEVTEIKDYYNNPKANGYSGYHIIVAIPYHHLDGTMEKVKVEIQIRTILMDMWAIVERNLRFKDLTPEERQIQLTKLAVTRKERDKKMEDIIEEANQLKENNHKKLIKTPTIE